MKLRFMLLCAAAMLGACKPAETQPASVEIKGTASYNERMLLPPGSTLVATLEDVTRADAPAEVITATEMQLQADTAPPIRFKLEFDPDRIVAKHRYHVRARITVGDKVLFRSHMGVPVLELKKNSYADVTMRAESTDPAYYVLPPQQRRGMYSYMADSGWFSDCLSGVRVPVAQQGENLALETAYMKSRPMHGAQMLVTLKGHLENVVFMEGIKTRPMLVVDQFISIEPRGCSGPSSTAQLENTYWKLMSLNNELVESPEGAREIHFVLNRDNFRLSGFAGCNSLTGNYRVDGEKLTFSDIAGTMMACSNGMVIERQIHEMFPRVAGWKISGETLQLVSSNGMRLATFESVYLR